MEHASSQTMTEPHDLSEATPATQPVPDMPSATPTSSSDGDVVAAETNDGGKGPVPQDAITPSASVSPEAHIEPNTLSTSPALEHDDAQPTPGKEDVPDDCPETPRDCVSSPMKSKAKPGESQAQGLNLPPALGSPEATRLIPAVTPESRAEVADESACGPKPAMADDPAINSVDGTETGSFDLKRLREYADSLGYSLHPVALAFPPMTALQYKTLKDSIQHDGRLRVRILTWEKQIIDGLHRLHACMESDITPTFEEWDGQGSLIEHVAALNGPRRHLTAGQKAAAAVELLPLLQQKAKKRQRQHGRTAPGRSRITLPEKIPEVLFEGGEAREEAARLTGANPRYVSDLIWVKEHDPALYEQVRIGQLKVPQAVEALLSGEPEECATPSEPRDGHPDSSQREDDAVAPRDDNSNKTVDAPASGVTVNSQPTNKKPTQMKGGRKRIKAGRTGRRKAPQAVNRGQTMATEQSALKGHPQDDGLAPPVFAPDDSTASSGQWTTESVDQALTQFGESTVKMAAFVNDPPVRECIGQMDRQVRERHRAAFLGLSQLLSSLIALVSDEET